MTLSEAIYSQVTSFEVMRCYVLSCGVTGVMWCYVVLLADMWCYVVLCGVMWLYLAICGAMWRYVELCDVM